MNLQEANARFKKTTITEEQLWMLSPIYCLLNFEKDDFCKLVESIGVDKWLQAAGRWERLDRAEQEYTAKEKYQKAQQRLSEIAAEKADLEEIISSYKKGR